MNFANAQNALMDLRMLVYVMQNYLSEPDPVRKFWLNELKSRPRDWPTTRETSQILELPEASWSCREFVMNHGGKYCEGLYTSPALEEPEAAIWANTDDKVICFTHDLSGEHGLIGLEFDLRPIMALQLWDRLPGPYLFSPYEAVCDALLGKHPEQASTGYPVPSLFGSAASTTEKLIQMR